MKVILNNDVKHLGEEGDVKNVAAGYARNYLFPRNLAVPFNDATVAYFEGRKAEIEARKEQKRKDSASLKDKLQELSLTLEMPAGANGKLYGAVTSQTIMEVLHKNGFEIERKRIEIPGAAIKNTGKYVIHIRLYESAFAEISVTVKAQVTEEAAPKQEKKPRRHKEHEAVAEEAAEEVKTEENE